MNGMDNLTGKPLVGLAHLRQSIADILTTPIGSRVMRRDYGSRIFQRIDAPITGELVAEIYADVVEALFNYEPRFEVSNVSVVSIADGKIVLDLEGKYLPTGETIKFENLNIS
ncbi:MAG: GPW/gp25 family protein [Alphaproteobacteria bacterium]|nr:GPW/gp25 family protein [Alphaproteobacteria bacterium]